MSKLKIIIISIIGEFLKIYYRCFRFNIGYGLNKEEKRTERVIISLTSYGHRVSSILPFTIYSLLRQTYKPDVILLWLDADNWNEENIPESLKKFRKCGLTIKFCEDIKSYKKLIPTLELFPNDLIITTDDDIFYRKNMVERLIDYYKKDPSCVYAHRAHRVGFDSDGNLLPYNNWEEEISNEVGPIVFPTGSGGCLYKRSLLYKDICDKNLFMRLTPKADDVWFYFMERLQKTNCKVLPYKGYIYIPLDAFYQHFHKGSNLANSNCNELQNDLQIKAVMDYYGLLSKDLRD